MFIELLDGLRCTADHPQVSLVAAIMKREDRFVIDGILGCPTCRREYPIENGVAWFRPASNGGAATHDDAPDDEGAVRIGAFLSASDGISVALVGKWARHAAELASLVGLRAFAVNPRVTLSESERVGVIQTDRRLPFANGSLRGIAIGEAGWAEADIERATATLSAGGRMVAPSATPVPDSVEEIARDDDWWIGEKRGALVSLHRR
jgi:uncharacterized protein YbaR (Trm112 family)